MILSECIVSETVINRYEVRDMVYTVEQVAEILQVSVQTVRKLIREKKLKSFRVGTQIRVRKEDLDLYMSGQ